MAAFSTNSNDERADEGNNTIGDIIGNIPNDEIDGAVSVSIDSFDFSAVSHRYFLQRLGLVADEVDWPSNFPKSKSSSSSSSSSTKTSNNGGSGGDVYSSAGSLCGGWRARDALISILGEKACRVQSDSGLTAVELLMLNKKQKRELEDVSTVLKSLPAATHAASAASLPIKSASSSQVVVSIDSILALLLNPGGTNSNSLEAPCMQQLINSEHVRQAFDAAAYAILRGESRQSQQSAASSSNNTATNVTTTASSTATGDADNTHVVITSTGGSRYDPPLLIAMEAIRQSRIEIFTDASSASSKSVPPFLKKNHTIPWFHVPVVAAGTLGGEAGVSLEKSSTKGVSAPISTSSLVVLAGGTSTPNNMEQSSNKVSLGVVEKAVKIDEKEIKKRSHPDDGNDVSSSMKKRIKLKKHGTMTSSSSPPLSLGTTSVKEKKKQSGGSGSGGKKAMKDKMRIADAITTTTTKVTKNISQGNKKQASPAPMKLMSSSTSKNASISPTGQTTKKYSRSPSSIIASEEAAATSSSLSHHPAITRAIVSGAAMKLFSEYAPNFNRDDGGANATAIMSAIIQGANLVETASESEEPTEESPMQGSAPSPSSLKHKVTEKNTLDMTNVNMQDIADRATSLGIRVWNESCRLARQSDQRREFRIDSALSRVDGVGGKCGVGGELKATNPFLVRSVHTLPLIAPNSFVTMKSGVLTDDMEGQDANGIPRVNNQGPTNLMKDIEWTESCLPRLLDIMSKGAGHAIVHDMEWTHRAGRVASMLQAMARSSSLLTTPTSNSCNQLPPTTTRRVPHPNFGPHLIVTSSGEDFDAFSAVFGRLGWGLHQSIFKTGKSGIDSVASQDGNGFKDDLLRVLPYHGSKAHRRQLRKHFGSIFPSSASHFSFLGGLPDSPFHVVLTTYSELLEDYAHFCHIPFQVVILDDGMSWLGCSHSDPHGDIGMLWKNLWSKFDFGSGSVGINDNGCKIFAPWDFSKEVAGLEPEDENGKNDNKPKNISADGLVGERGGGHARFPIGLTARHRILLASGMHTQYKGQVHKASVLGLLTFLSPQFADTIIDDWEQSRVSRCKQSMSCFRSMIARLVIVYSGDDTARSPDDLIAFSLRALNGDLPLRSSITGSSERDDDGLDELVQSQKIIHSQKIASSWFPPTSSIRKEIRLMSPKPILAGIKRSTAIGFFCEEIATASSLTTAGATGSVVGLSAYRAAVRCGRCFTSESGLKQHIISSHAPPGTWLCRSCGGDCGTSQARAHHERACRVPRKFLLPSSAGSDVVPGSAVGKGGGKQPMSTDEESSAEFVLDSADMKHVTGYAGVWKLANGKFVVKIDGKLLMDYESESNDPFLFDTAELASKKFDQIAAESGSARKLKIHYPPRTQFEDESKSRNILAGNKKKNKVKADIVTPDLSVIDIKKLPPHVKPLLRDPNFTSRTGGNSKRYVYAYRGVCRQERKGHERWQSQISFNGQNHYLGTFDTEWDAAAVYAWAHLILYGEEATKKAQREGEEAAAAFKQNQQEIAEGRVPTPSPKPAVKKKRGAPKKVKVEITSTSLNPSVEETCKSEKALVKAVKPEITKSTLDSLPKLKVSSPAAAPTATSVHGKKKRPVSSKEWSKLKMECAMMLSSGTKGTSKASVLATRKDIADMSEQTLLKNVSDYTTSDSISSVSKMFLDTIQCPGIKFHQLPASRNSSSIAVPMRPCLIGLRASDFGWDVNKFVDLCQAASVEAEIISSKISFEFDIASTSFFAFVFSSPFTLGRASKESIDALELNPQTVNALGMPIGNLDCNVGGLDSSCSETAAKILCAPTKHSNFQFAACNNDDIITLNGRRIYANMGQLPLRDRDICSVGARVFIFVENAVDRSHI